MTYTVTFRNAISATGRETHVYDTLAEAEQAARTHRPWNNTAHTIRKTPQPDPVTVRDGVTIVGPTAFGSYHYRVDGQEVVSVQRQGSQWHVYLTRALGTGRWLNSLDRAMAEAQRMAQGYTRCNKPVACRLCRLAKRHDGPCIPWD